MPKSSNLQAYQKKRDFAKTPEPAGKVHASPDGHLYVIQKHAASRLHYDLRLELNGTLKSWAVPKGPCLDPAEKRLAVHVEDHPVEYGSFEGIIPKDEYGGGTVMLWDRGWWEPLSDEQAGYEKGHLKFRLHGEKLQGVWALVQMHGPRSEEGKNWLLIKDKDEAARPLAEYDVLTEEQSVKTQRGMDEIAKAQDRVWTDDGEAVGKEVEEKLAKPKAAKTKAKNNNAGETPALRKDAEAIDPSQLTHARKGKQPEFLPPELATLVDAVPDGDNYLHEVKFDGYRLLAVIRAGKTTLLTRHGNDWTKKFSAIAEAVESLHLEEAILDGEVVVLNKQGLSDFQALQNTLQEGAKNPLTYFVFDLPWCGGFDLTASPLLERKQLLARLFNRDHSAQLRLSEHIQGHGPLVFENACKLHLEGILSKRADSSYETRRTRAWCKIKCIDRQEFIIAGYSDPSGARAHFGALLLAYYDKAKRLQYCGKVGTGFNEHTLRSVYQAMKSLEQKDPVVGNPPHGAEARGVHWLKPELVAEVAFAEWTQDGQLRHPSFQGLREDKPPQEVVREKAVTGNDAVHSVHKEDIAQNTPHRRGPKIADPVVGGVSISNANRVLYPEQDVTKLALAQYYEAISDWILPHIARRPLSVVRCPQGLDGNCFYQRHVNESLPPAIRGVPIETDEGLQNYLLIDDLKGLISLIQFGVLEIHPWGCHEQSVEQPDYLTFDLDPAPGLPWERVIEAALLLRKRLEEEGLKSFIKTSGGKGLHIVAPLEPEAGWDDLKAFTKSIAERMAHEEPKKYVATMSKAKRTGKIFIDYLRNSRTATSVAPYSTRARKGAPVSAPIRWNELEQGIAPDAFTIENLLERLQKLKAAHQDPWKDFFKIKHAIPILAHR